MAYVYLIVALSWLLGLLCLAVLLAPPVLWFLHRRDANFARPVRWVARIDLAFILSWFVSFFFFNLRDVRPDGVGYDLLYIVFGLLTLIAVWKMKAGEGFRGLFRNPGTGKFPFAVYLLTAAGVAVVTVVSLVSYVIVAACIVLLSGCCSSSWTSFRWPSAVPAGAAVCRWAASEAARAAVRIRTGVGPSCRATRRATPRWKTLRAACAN